MGVPVMRLAFFKSGRFQLRRNWDQSCIEALRAL